MNETDDILKQLFNAFGLELAEWLLNVQVKNARDASGELPPIKNTVRTDYLLELTLLDNTKFLFHIEFQGRSTHRPMPWRMLEYDSRLVEQKGLPVCSAIIYLGHGAGVNDNGEHIQWCPITQQPIFQWRYQVLHLWQWKAEALLALEQPVLLSLIGQTQIEQPELIFPKALAVIKAQSDVIFREQLLVSFLNLITKEEWITMVEQLIVEDAILETPFIRRQRAWREEGKQEGKQEGRLEGKLEGRLEGKQEGELNQARHSLRLLLKKRFNDVPMWANEKIEQADKALLDTWLLRLLEATSLTAVFADD